MSVKDLGEILKFIIAREEKLDNLYSSLLQKNKNERCRTMFKLLKVQQDIVLRILKSVSIKEFIKASLVKYANDFQMEAVLRLVKVSENSLPEDMLLKVLSTEEKIEEYYKHLNDIFVNSKSKVFLDMLVHFKAGQIKAIRSLLESCSLAPR